MLIWTQGKWWWLNHFLQNSLQWHQNRFDMCLCSEFFDSLASILVDLAEDQLLIGGDFNAVSGVWWILLLGNFLFFSTGHMTLSRIDYIFVSKILFSDVHITDMIPISLSDQRAVLCIFSLRVHQLRSCLLAFQHRPTSEWHFQKRTEGWTECNECLININSVSVDECYGMQSKASEIKQYPLPQILIKLENIILSFWELKL